ncbi:hypothetical protein KFL_006210035 [Klebsormidium nitens]|uniref:C3H1-type domain-containing protein n=1 Tax=Klebsormidium nitens TaxID=105231 RepID=A0A1Y1ILG3_KLENI|nr:hypothetical protein KFL_006210035 [Klebsormidium nitens]|eukprot:GAQ90279.1 hypothetical protein KFL_006210035 [Klebsormidium nitens]
MSSSGNGAPPQRSLRHVFSKPKEKPTEVTDAEWYLAKWKTKPCQFTVCPNAWGCPYAHGENERRRSPVSFTYSAEACPDAPDCPRGDECELAHNYNEQAFHPSVYKTVPCADFPWHCNQGTRCPNAHGYRDMRRAPSAGRTRPRRSVSVGGLADVTPPPRHVKTMSNIPGDRTGRFGGPTPEDYERASSGFKEGYEPVSRGLREGYEPRIIPQEGPGRTNRGPVRNGRGNNTEEETEEDDTPPAAGGQSGGYTWQQTPAEVRDVLAADLISRMVTQAAEESDLERAAERAPRRPPERTSRSGGAPRRGNAGEGFVRSAAREIDTWAVDSKAQNGHVRSFSAFSVRGRQYGPPGDPPEETPSPREEKRPLSRDSYASRIRDRGMSLGGDPPPRDSYSSRGVSLGGETEWQAELASLLRRHPSRGRDRGIPLGRGSSALVDAQRGETDELLSNLNSPSPRVLSRFASPRRMTSADSPIRRVMSADSPTGIVSQARDAFSRARTCRSFSGEEMSRNIVPSERKKNDSGDSEAERYAAKEKQTENGTDRDNGTGREYLNEDGNGANRKPKVVAKRPDLKVEIPMSQRLSEFAAFQTDTVAGLRRHRRNDSAVSEILPPRGAKDHPPSSDFEPSKDEKESKRDEELVKRPTEEMRRTRRTAAKSVDSVLLSRGGPTEPIPEPPTPPPEGQLEPGVLYTLLHSPVPQAAELQKKVAAICEEEGVELLWTPVGDDVTPMSVRHGADVRSDVEESPVESPQGGDAVGASKSPTVAEKGRKLSPLPSRAPTPRVTRVPTLTGPRGAIASAEQKIAALFQGVASTTARFPSQFLWYLEEGFGGRERLDLLRGKHGVEFTISLPSDSLTVWLGGGGVHRKVMAYLRELAGAMGAPAQLAQIMEEPGGEENEKGWGPTVVETNKTALERVLPPHWKKEGLSSGKWHLVAVPEDSPEWAECIKKLRGSLAPTSVVRLLRFQSPRQWQRFTSERERTEGANSHPGSSHSLFATCTKSEVQAVCSGGFAASVANADSDDVILGSMFTSEAWQALQFAPRTSDGLRILVMVEAALGGAWLERNLTLLTEKVDGGGDFDAIVDSLTNPQVFAIARKQQAYPAYVLEVAPDPQADGPDVHTSFTLLEEPSAPSDDASPKPDDVAEPPEKPAEKPAPACCVIL